MPTSKEEVKKAIDNFEEDNYYDSEETLSKEIKKAKNDYLKKTLDLENDVEDIEPEEDTTDDNTEDDDPDTDDDPDDD